MQKFHPISMLGKLRKIPHFGSDMEDVELIEGLLAHDAKAYERLVDRFQQRVFKTCLGFTFNQDDAQDLCQEVFLEVFRSIQSFERRAALATWIHRIAVTKSLELIRNRNRKKRAGQLLSIFGLQQAGWDARADAIDHPGFQLEHKEHARQLYAAIDSLPEQQRIAFTLQKVEGRSYEEVAEIMETTVSSVESLLFRARKGLQKRLENYYRANL